MKVEVCKQVFKHSSFPSKCPRCQSLNLVNIDLNLLRLPIEEMTLRQLRRLASFSNRSSRLRFRDLDVIRQTIPTLEEVKQKEIIRQHELKQAEIKRKELLKQGYCPHCKVPVVVLMLDCPQCQRPYEA